MLDGEITETIVCPKCCGTLYFYTIERHAVGHRLADNKPCFTNKIFDFVLDPAEEEVLECHDCGLKFDDFDEVRLYKETLKKEEESQNV